MAQRPRDGRIQVVEVPEPRPRPGWVLVRNRHSVISAGTERAKVEMGEKSLLQKARARPDLVYKAVSRARTEGIRSTAAAAREQLGALAAIGYSSAGVVESVGAGVEGVAPGSRVACGGGGWANHAEVVSVPRNLITPVPEGVGLDEAAYATIGAIALQGFRRAGAVVGDDVGVIGLGLVGQLAAQLASAAGCRVQGIDVDPQAAELARRGGAAGFVREEEGLVERVRAATRGRGLDSVLVCAASASSDPVNLAVELCRDSGCIVVVGDVPIEPSRAAMYEKELDLRLARSYGPGRYDPAYEEGGRDYPVGQVRWTEQRNMQAFVDLLAGGKLDVGALTTYRFPVERASDAYDAVSGRTDERAFGVLIDYPAEASSPAPVAQVRARARPGSVPRVGLIGTGSFAKRHLLPALAAGAAELAAVASERGLSAADVGERLGVDRVAASAEELVADSSLDAVVIATRHDSHARLVAAALHEGKAVFVEKPLALDWEQLEEVEAALAHSRGPLMVGFNRRFAPLVERLAEELGGARGAFTARVNAGPLPETHWLHDPAQGGGRLIGEGCHFVDLLGHLAAAPAITVHAVAVPNAARGLECSDELVASLQYANGSVASLVYSGAGDGRMPKERFEVFADGLSASLEDFRRLELFRGGARKVVKARQDKGHRAGVDQFLAVVAGKQDAQSPEAYLDSMRATLALADSLRSGLPVSLS
ncbi:MAG: Gfo/Idh/MocA family oxidoreductase [Thermoleophilaceae bacterium]|nr:Gfo/Idh/MocA family oxidoreductase [Thermoleophilaceae bacterium]